MKDLRDRYRDRDEPHPDSGLAAIARSLGATARLVRRLVAKPDSHRTPPEVEPSREKESTTALRRRRRLVLSKVAVLEAEVERLYQVVGAGAPEDVSGEGGAIETLQKARDELRAGRLELAGIDRNIARERRLRQSRLMEHRRVEHGGGGAERLLVSDQSAPILESTRRRRRRVERALRVRRTEDRMERLSLHKTARCLLDDDAAVRRGAVAQLAGSRSPAARELLGVALDDSSHSVRVAALNALSKTPDKASRRTLRRHLRDQDAQVRLAALRGLSAVEGELSNRELMSALEDADPAVRRSACTMLGWREVDEAVSALCFALGDVDETVRAAAADSLSNLGSERTVYSLIGAVADESPAVRSAVDRALRNLIGDDLDIVPADADPTERARALKQWWSDARVDRFATRRGAPVPAPSPKRPAAPRPAAEPTPPELAETVAGDQESPATSGLYQAVPEAAGEEETALGDVVAEGAEEEGADFESMFGLDEEAPDIGIADAAPDVGLDDAAPDIGLDDAAPDVGLDDAAPDIGLDDAAPDVGIADAAPDVGGFEDIGLSDDEEGEGDFLPLLGDEEDADADGDYESVLGEDEEASDEKGDG